MGRVGVETVETVGVETVETVGVGTVGVARVRGPHGVVVAREVETSARDFGDGEGDGGGGEEVGVILDEIAELAIGAGAHLRRANRAMVVDAVVEMVVDVVCIVVLLLVLLLLVLLLLLLLLVILEGAGVRGVHLVEDARVVFRARGAVVAVAERAKPRMRDGREHARARMTALVARAVTRGRGGRAREEPTAAADDEVGRIDRPDREGRARVAARRVRETRARARASRTAHHERDEGATKPAHLDRDAAPGAVTRIDVSYETKL